MMRKLGVAIDGVVKEEKELQQLSGDTKTMILGASVYG
jgi:hypothetical protein